MISRKFSTQQVSALKQCFNLDPESYTVLRGLNREEATPVANKRVCEALASGALIDLYGVCPNTGYLRCRLTTAGTVILQAANMLLEDPTPMQPSNQNLEQSPVTFCAYPGCQEFMGKTAAEVVVLMAHDDGPTWTWYCCQLHAAWAMLADTVDRGGNLCSTDKMIAMTANSLHGIPQLFGDEAQA